MGTTFYFDEIVKDQNGKDQMQIEIARSSYYAGCKLDNGQTGEDSILIRINGGSGVIMDLETAKRFVEAVMKVGQYHSLID